MSKIALVVAMVFGCTYISAAAEDPNEELYFKTESGEIVLTYEACPLKGGMEKKFEYRAYATEEGFDDHPGCWFEDGPAVNVWFPEIKAVATYHAKIFKRRQHV